MKTFFLILFTISIHLSFTGYASALPSSGKGTTTCEEILERGDLELPPHVSGDLAYGWERRLRRNEIQGISRLQRKFGEEAGMYYIEQHPKAPEFLNWPNRLFVTRADYIAAILKKPELAGRLYKNSPMLTTEMGPQSFFIQDSAHGDDRAAWAFTHKVLMPYFTPGFVERNYIPELRVRAAALAGDWASGGARNVSTAIQYYVIANIFKTLYGYELTKETALRYDEALEMIFAGADSAKSRQVRADFEALLSPAVEAARSEPGSGRLIDAVIKAQGEAGLPESWIYDQLISIFYAGQETVKTMLHISLSLLATMPERQAQLRNEYLSAGPAGKAGWLKESENFLNESMRLYPPVRDLTRYNRMDLRIGPYFVPAGTVIELMFTTGFRSKAQWGADAASFRPERWNELNIRRDEFCPFSFGPRVCIGQHLAMVEAKVLIGEILRENEIRLAEPFELSQYDREFTLVKFSKPLQLEFKQKNL